MDLAKIERVKHLFVSFRSDEGADALVNEWLMKGWVIITVKVVEERYSQRERDDKCHRIVHPFLVYVLGEPRNRPSQRETNEQKARRKDDESWRRQNLEISDPRHPDYQAHAKSVT